MALVHIGETELPKSTVLLPPEVVKRPMFPAEMEEALHVSLVTFVDEIKPLKPPRVLVLEQVSVRLVVPSWI